MDQGLIPRRYAKALYKFALENGSDAAVYGLMKTLACSFGENPGLMQAVANPFVDAADKVALLSAAAGAGSGDRCFADFLKLLVDNKRIDMSRDIAVAYMDLYRKANRIYRVEVVTAGKLDEASMARLKELVERHLDGGSMEYSERVDPELIGGFVVNIDNERLDASVSNEFKQLRLKLLSNQY